MGSLQDELKKLASGTFAETQTEGGEAAKVAPRPSPSIAEPQKLAGITSIPVSPQANLAGYAREVSQICESLLGSLQQVSLHLDRYQPTEAEAKLATGRSYKDLKVAVKGLSERATQVRRLAAEITK